MMKKLVFVLPVLIWHSAISQQKTTVAKTSSDKLSPHATVLFKDVKTKLSVKEKNVIATACSLTLNKAKTKFIADMDNYYTVKAYPTDMNADGVEEIFVNQSGSSFGNTGNFFDLFFKNSKGEYVNVAGAIALPLITKSRYNGYPELIMGGPGMSQPVWRFDGKKYDWNRTIGDQDVSGMGVEEVSAAYLSGQNEDAVIAAPETMDQNIKPGNTASPSNGKNKPIAAEAILSPLAQFLFRNCKTGLSAADKNELVLLIGLTASDTVGQGKNNKPKIEYNVYPVDFNSDGVEEVFVKATTKFLGIPTNEYSFFAKDKSGHYKAAPGKFGNGAKIVVSDKSVFPYLLAKPLVADGTGNLNVWMWNGNIYYLAKKITAADSYKVKRVDIEDKSDEYTRQLK